MTTRLYWPYKTINHAARMFGLRELSPEETNRIAWEYTGYPEFFTEPLSFEKQILEFMRTWKATGKWPRHELDCSAPTSQTKQGE